MTSIPASYIDGPLQTVLVELFLLVLLTTQNTANIPFTMLASIILLRRRYSPVHWIASTIIIGVSTVLDSYLSVRVFCLQCGLIYHNQGLITPIYFGVCSLSGLAEYLLPH